MASKNIQNDDEQGFAEEALRAVMAIELAQQTTIHNAELEARQIVEAANDQAQVLRAAEKTKWQQESQVKLVQYRQETDAQVQALRAQAQAQSQQWLNKANANKDRAVELAVRVVTLTDSVD